MTGQLVAQVQTFSLTEGRRANSKDSYMPRRADFYQGTEMEPDKGMEIVRRVIIGKVQNILLAEYTFCGPPFTSYAYYPCVVG